MPGGYLVDADWLTREPPTEDAWFGAVERERERAPPATGGAPFEESIYFFFPGFAGAGSGISTSPAAFRISR